MSTLETLDIAMRGGAIALCLLLALQMLLKGPARPIALVAACFSLSAASYILVSAPYGEAMLGPAALPAHFLGFLAAPLFWMFASSLVQDGFRPSRLQWLAMAANTTLFWPICVFEPENTWIVWKLAHLVISAACIGLCLFELNKSRVGDLVESRRAVSASLLFVMPLTGAVIMIFSALEVMHLDNPGTAHWRSLLLLITAATLALSLSGVRSQLLAPPTARPRAPLEALPAADRMELRRLLTQMENGVYLEPGLTIGALAERLNIPEHRVRRLINQHLGYRNFAAFINDHRIDEAKRRLSNAELAREQITGIAFDLGFASLAPFNRAFRERVGMSPSEFRFQALETNG
jgi:AraC-like DNA-binding protein